MKWTIAYTATAAVVLVELFIVAIVLAVLYPAFYADLGTIMH